MQRIYLKSGDTFELNSKIYTVKSVIGDGATCVVYSAEFKDNKGYPHRVNIKECYPYNASISREGTILKWELDDEKEKHLALILERKSNKDLYEETRYLEGELQKALVRQQKVSNLYEKLYEDNAEGKVTDEWFAHMSHKYEMERTELKGKISELRKKLSSTQETTKGKEIFLNAVRSFIEMETLTAPLAKELIDHIDVYEAEGKGKNKTQRIVIYYRFVGYIELPDKIPIVNDTRQGVAVNYISGALPETA